MKPVDLLIGAFLLLMAPLLVLAFVEIWEMSTLRHKVTAWRKHREWKATKEYIKGLKEVSK